MKKEIKKKGRRNALEGLRKAMREMEADGMRKVTVAAPDSESLKEGLKMAESKVDEMEEMAEKMSDDDEKEEKKDSLEDKSREELIEMLKEKME